MSGLHPGARRSEAPAAAPSPCLPDPDAGRQGTGAGAGAGAGLPTALGGPGAGRAPLVPETLRVRIGASTATAPGMLDTLAHDPLPLVRAAVAMNEAAPAAADRSLAEDPDAHVRELLARKLAALLPSLTEPERQALRHHAQAVLYRLAADAAEQVRLAIAEVVADMPHAPRALILRLAHDAAVPVSEPVVRLSPLLTEADLLALLVAAPNPAVATAVARRSCLSEAVCDAVIASASAPAVCALLANPGAAIREATLDALVAAAARPGPDHAPACPGLPPGTADTLRGIVLDKVMDLMMHQAELEVDVGSELRRRLSLRLLPGRGPLPAGAGMGAAVALEEAFQQRDRGGLDEAALLRAAQGGEARLLGALLSVAAGVPLGVVDRAARLRSAKGLVSLIWKAGFSMRVAGPVQAVLARLSPPQLLLAAADGRFPLEPSEMRWQVHFLSHVGW